MIVLILQTVSNISRSEKLMKEKEKVQEWGSNCQLRLYKKINPISITDEKYISCHPVEKHKRTQIEVQGSKEFK